jgi:hypothetical protein
MVCRSLKPPVCLSKRNDTSTGLVKKDNVASGESLDLELPRIKVRSSLDVTKHVLMIFLAVADVRVENVIAFREIFVRVVVNAESGDLNQEFLPGSAVHTIDPRANVQPGGTPILNGLSCTIVEAVCHNNEHLLAVEIFLSEFHVKLRAVCGLQTVGLT